MDIKYIKYEDILPLWELLQPKRNHIKFSGMEFNKGLQGTGWIKNISEKELQIKFFGAYIDNILCGCNSGHLTPNNMYRSRGLYVLPQFRKQGIGQKLLKRTIREAKNENQSIIWSFPRKQSFNTYVNIGFIKVSKWINADYGTNCFVSYIL